MKEYMNYLAHFYDEGSYAEDLPPKKRVFTESEMQRAISMALMYHGIYSHIDKGEKMKYFGFVEDRLKVMDRRRTKSYESYEEAHKAAEALCKRTIGDRGIIGVEVIHN